MVQFATQRKQPMSAHERGYIIIDVLILLFFLAGHFVRSRTVFWTVIGFIVVNIIQLAIKHRRRTRC